MPEDTSRWSTVGSRLSRRGSLALAAGLGLGAIGGLAHHRFDSPPVADTSESRQDFLWLSGGLWEGETIRENLFAFAQRHDLAVVLVVSPRVAPTPRRSRRPSSRRTSTGWTSGSIRDC
ncbi:hypothetical protein ACFQMM_09270 [Saliphagus sp. GCM10025308]